VIGGWSQGGVAAFGRNDAVAAGVTEEDGLSQARARSKQCACAARLRLPRIQNAEVLRAKMFEAVTPRAQVIQEDHVRNFKLLNQSLRFDDPGKVRGAHEAVDDRAGDAGSGR